MSIESNIVDARKLPDAWKESMFDLYGRYFCNTSQDSFLRDLAEKDWVILLRDGDRIVGFSTQMVFWLRVNDREHAFLFSGDTIVDRAHWQDSGLAGSFGHVMLRLIRESGGTPLYWFLISKGYRTYRFLPVFFNRFYPAFDRTTPPEVARLIDAAANHKFGGAYDAATGLVRFGGRKDRLRPEMCEIPESRRRDPHVRFFLEKNPGYRLGDELACLAPIHHDNLNALACRVIRGTNPVWQC
jgi:hypothetical protein